MAGDTNLTEKDKEIINLATSLAAGCQPCLKYHLRKSKDVGLSEKEIYDIINQADMIYKRAKKLMKLRALDYVNANPVKKTGVHSGCQSRKEILVGLAVSYTVNSTDMTDQYLACARKSKMSESEISGILKLSKFTWSKARAHVDLMIEGTGVKSQEGEKDEDKCGCGC